MKNKVAIVCLYGLFDKEKRTEIEYYGYTHYLRKVCDYLNGFHYLTDVILCGGYTNGPDLPAECDSVLPFVKELLRPEIEIHCEDESKNTPQNIYFAIRDFVSACEEYEGIDGEIIICVDRKRHYKTTVITKLLSNWYPCCRRLKEVKVVGFCRPDIHPHSSYTYQFAAAMDYRLSDFFSVFGDGDSELEKDLKKK